MTDYELDISNVASIHAYLRGTEHVGSMDCRCEPVTKIQIEHRGRMIDIVVHGDDIAVLPVMRQSG